MNSESKEYWEAYYKNHLDPFKSSQFAQFVLKYLEPKDHLIELGCGNGRDSIFFNKKGIKVTSIDQCDNEIQYLSSKYSNKDLDFINKDFTRLSVDKRYDAIYSRFTIHSVDMPAENRILSWAKDSLQKGGYFFIEVRGIFDSLYGVGKKIGENEFFSDHYRRFIEFNDLKKKLVGLGFELKFAKEEADFAPHKTENPICIRIVAQKN